MELFQQTQPKESPLAYRMRPRTINEFIGQDHIAAPGRLLRRIIQADRMSSIIFYGPPGTGKTTLARVIANTTKSSFITMNAVLDGVKNLREAITEAQKDRDLYAKRTILFVDEVHRWNKSQQDALLPWVENGTVILIGATTENPYFEVNKALVSRSRIFQLKPLNKQNLTDIAIQAINNKERGYGKYKITLEQGALEHLVDTANGDARSLLNAVELAVETSVENFPPEENTAINISLEAAEESIQKKALLYDKEGDYHYDTISAFIKSIRGSDPDGVLYWLATMIQAGEDPRYIFRRMLISASEDIGLADPNALCIVESAAAAFDRVGLPEGRFHLTQAALYLSTAPKSNTCLSFFDALNTVKEEFAKEVPNHLKDAGRDKEGFGHGEGYLYPHAYKDHWIAQQYLPSGLQGKIFYQPSNQGYEAKIKEKITRQREIQLVSIIEPQNKEILTFSPPQKNSQEWLNRINRETGKTISTLRDLLLTKPGTNKQKTIFNRHDCVLTIEPSVPTLLWEAVRQTPEGSVWYIPQDPKSASISRHYAKNLPKENQPIEIKIPQKTETSLSRIPKEQLFEKIIIRDIFTQKNYINTEKETIFQLLKKKLQTDGEIHLCQIIPSKAQRLTKIPEMTKLKNENPELFTSLEKAEKKVYSNTKNPLVNWTEQEIAKAAEKSSLKIQSQTIEIEENRLIQKKDIDNWLEPNGNGLGKALKENHDIESIKEINKITTLSIANRTIKWKLTFMLLKANL